MTNAEVQQIAKQTIHFIKSQIKVGMSLQELRQLAESKMFLLGATSFWYWDIGAFIFRVKKQRFLYLVSTIKPQTDL